jgi:hypothetical protein
MRHLAVQWYLGSSRITHYSISSLIFPGDATAGPAEAGSVGGTTYEIQEEFWAVSRLMSTHSWTVRANQS